MARRTESQSYTATPVPAITQTPTPTAFPTSTLSSAQYLALSKVVLTIGDISTDAGWDDFSEYFFGPSDAPVDQRSRPALKDITASLAGHCFVDCAAVLLSLPGRSVAVYLVRYASPGDAKQASEKLCLDIYQTEFNQKLDGINNCIGSSMGTDPAPTLDTWIAPYYKQDVLGATYGSIFIKVVLYFPGRWDEYYTKANILLDVAAFQVQKLKQAGFPATP
jgi:hypothetical protein